MIHLEVLYDDGSASRWVYFANTDQTWRRYDHNPEGVLIGQYCDTGHRGETPPEPLPVPTGRKIVEIR